jgi:alkylation response protein AidB-like acyl-CoA dehydrogenase
VDLTLSDAEAAFAAEARAWLAAHVERPGPFTSQDDEVAWGRQWQAKLAADRWVGISWPEGVGGRSASPVEVALFNMEYARAGAPQPVNRVGINLAGPTLLAYGTPAQQRRWLPPILDAREMWCQLFSEPDAGSDLASLRTTGRRAEGGWLVSGQKLWTSYARFARWGLALVRTDPDGPVAATPGSRSSSAGSEPPRQRKHEGISYLVVDMDQPGVDIRPLRQITGEAEFNEVFLDEVFVPDDHRVGGLGQGWAVANATLAHERGTSFPFKEQVVHEVYLDELVHLAAARSSLDDPVIADALAQAFVELRVLRLHNWRTLSRLGHGHPPGGESSWIKLAWTAMTQHLSRTALDVLGDEAPLWPDPDGGTSAGTWQRQWLWSRAASIAGGTSEIQRTVIGERLLGLPR